MKRLAHASRHSSRSAFNRPSRRRRPTEVRESGGLKRGAQIRGYLYPQLSRVLVTPEFAYQLLSGTLKTNYRPLVLELPTHFFRPIYVFAQQGKRFSPHGARWLYEDRNGDLEGIGQ